MVTKFVLMMRTFKVYFLATFEYATQCYYLSPRGNSSMLLCYCYCWPGWESSGVRQGRARSGGVRRGRASPGASKASAHGDGCIAFWTPVSLRYVRRTGSTGGECGLSRDVMLLCGISRKSKGPRSLCTMPQPAHDVPLGTYFSYLLFLYFGIGRTSRIHSSTYCSAHLAPSTWCL